MIFEITIEAYNRYISKRRKELGIDSNVQIVCDYKSERINETTGSLSFAVFYNHPSKRKELLYYSLMFHFTNSGKKSAAAKCIAKWIDFFSENEDRIVEGRVWR